MNFQRRNRSKRLSLPEISLTPLIDTALTLLIIFMITTPMLQDSIKVNLPETKNSKGASQTKPEQLIVSIDQKGKIFFNDKETKLADLPRTIAQKIGSTQDNMIVVKGDRDLVYNKIVEVVYALQGLEGVSNVALATKHRT